MRAGRTFLPYPDPLSRSQAERQGGKVMSALLKRITRVAAATIVTSAGLGLAGLGAATVAQAQPAPFPDYHWCPGDYWDPGWADNWDWGRCHDDHWYDGDAHDHWHHHHW
jgi:hypothetical protein